MNERQGGKDELSRSLRTLREAANINTREAADRAGFSQSKVSRLERGKNIPTEADVTTLLDLYQVHADQRTALLEMARDVKAEHRPVVLARGEGRPAMFQERLVRMEATAAHVRAYHPNAVPGLLQTEPYMRALIANRALPGRELQAFVEKRVERQKALGRSGTQFTVICTVGGLGWRLGSTADMAEQADHIVSRMDTANLDLGIIPWGTGASRLVLNGFDIYDERAVSYGVANATAILNAHTDVARYVEIFEELVGLAAWGDAARAVLAEVAGRYRSMGVAT